MMSSSSNESSLQKLKFVLSGNFRRAEKIVQTLRAVHFKAHFFQRLRQSTAQNNFLL